MIVSSEPAEVFIVGVAICSVCVCEKVDRRNVREHWQKKVERAQVGVQWPRAQYCAEIGALLSKSFTRFVIFFIALIFEACETKTNISAR